VSRNLFWLSDEQWRRIEPHLPLMCAVSSGKTIARYQRHHTRAEKRLPLVDCPEAYGPPMTIYNRFARWTRRGIWENLFVSLPGNVDRRNTQMIDSTHVKAHRSAAGGKRGEQKQGCWPLAWRDATRRYTHSQMLRGG